MKKVVAEVVVCYHHNDLCKVAHEDTWEESQHEEEKEHHDGHLDKLVGGVVDKVTQGLDDMANEAGEWDNKDVEVVAVDEDAEHHQVVVHDEKDEKLVVDQQNYLKQMVKLC